MWATVDDVKLRWLLPEPITATDEQIDALVEEAEDTILGRFPDMASRVPSPIPLARVRKITVALVIEKLKNPSGTRQANTTTGPFTDSVTYGGANPGAMILTNDQIKELSGSRTGAAFTVNTIPVGYPWRWR
ncbi:hypothetical protein M2390_000494 [Mycetocola sp. BIGb0189]|uniref:hypothetical protein n=1 Tax=Mycetocola sp. BIGb0189 TaxID=2940604 RepID=UPI002167F48C|nr:hypothetical protein [Mycetocola sp. BIGb0189]MCS4275333.1 hypothetical protein [Mycetocola sp. BIGb0189]